ncbi:aspartate/glutamate racemase family protein [Bacillus salipaludis]|uniref:Amino acid racemase n=1 Tax=Bacillus salipaludis TaxID=2547811 RepID=A0AA90QRR1_9BACI|nr:amino acid racemase [Bacillus salipaludis]MDQ6595279.1 amino acid racemase [Bacillus salipaludis]
MKSLGVIGGMGPKATSVFFDKVVENTVADRDQDHIDIMILNHATLPDRTEAILNGRDDLFLDAVKKDFKLLEFAGVSHIAIPCNTSHYFYDQMQAMTEIPIIHMVDETLKVIYQKYGENAKVGLLATKGTISSGIYEKESSKYKMQMYVPSEAVQKQTMDIIYSIKADKMIDPLELEEMIHQLIFDEGCNCVVLACTELSCVRIGDEAAQYCVDALEVLVEQSIALSGGTSKKQNSSAVYS